MDMLSTHDIKVNLNIVPSPVKIIFKMKYKKYVLK